MQDNKFFSRKWILALWAMALLTFTIIYAIKDKANLPILQVVAPFVTAIVLAYFGVNYFQKRIGE